MGQGLKKDKQRSTTVNLLEGSYQMNWFTFKGLLKVSSKFSVQYFHPLLYSPVFWGKCLLQIFSYTITVQWRCIKEVQFLDFMWWKADFLVRFCSNEKKMRGLYTKACLLLLQCTKGTTITTTTKIPSAHGWKVVPGGLDEVDNFGQQETRGLTSGTLEWS